MSMFEVAAEGDASSFTKKKKMVDYRLMRGKSRLGTGQVNLN